VDDARLERQQRAERLDRARRVVLFITRDEVEAAWAFIDPIRQA